MSARVMQRRQLAGEVVQLAVHAPLIAAERKPGQFVIVQLDEDFGERIPLTIAGADRQAGTITLIFQTVGKTTHLLGELREGDVIANLLGPLGQPTHIETFGHVIAVGGGIGAAPLYPIATAMREAGNKLTVVLGARNRDLVILEEELRTVSDEFILCTDDGSAGRKALVTEPLQELCERTPAPDLVVAIGPPVMMKFCAETTRPYGIHTVVSLNTIMIDGTGMCGGCRVSVDGETRFVCVDGPEFDGHKVDFDNMIQRLGAYRQHEDAAHEKCHLELQANERRASQT